MAEIVAIIVLSAVDTTNGWVGVGGAVGVLIAVFVAIAAGTLAGLVVAAAGSILFVIEIAYAQPPDPVAGGLVIVVVWCTAAVASGALASVLRQRADDAYREVEVARDDAIRVSATLQRSFMPERLPTVPGVDLAAYFRPAGDGTEIGGDFYDVWAVTPDSFGAAIGDVCGKGAEAATITSLARHTIRTAAIIDPRPCQALHAVNLAIIRRVGNARFITAAALQGTLTPTHISLQICIGGHPLPLLLDQAGVVREAGQSGTLLGIYHDVDLVSTRLDLLPGESLILYTDGLTEPATIKEPSENTA